MRSPLSFVLTLPFASCLLPSLRSGFRQHGANLLHVLPDLSLLHRVAQEVSGVEGRHERRAFVVVELAAHLRDRFLRAEQRARRSVAEGDDDARADECRLAMQVRREEVEPFGRYLVAGTDYLHDVRQVALA